MKLRFISQIINVHHINIITTSCNKNNQPNFMDISEIYINDGAINNQIQNINIYGKDLTNKLETYINSKDYVLDSIHYGETDQSTWKEQSSTSANLIEAVTNGTHNVWDDNYYITNSRATYDTARYRDNSGNTHYYHKLVIKLQQKQTITN